MLPPPPSSTLFPYTTLFRSLLVFAGCREAMREIAARKLGAIDPPLLLLGDELEIGAARRFRALDDAVGHPRDRKSTRLNSSHTVISYAVFCLKKKNKRKSST